MTSDGGLLLVRELDERFGFGELIERHLTDGRAKNTQLPLTDLVRQSVCSRLAGYEDVNDAERLSQDPAFRLIGSGESVGARSGVDLALAIVRDGTGRRKQKTWPAWPCSIGSWSLDSTEIPLDGRRERLPTTDTSSPPATIRCCCSTVTATAWR